MLFPSEFSSHDKRGELISNPIGFSMYSQVRFEIPTMWFFSGEHININRILIPDKNNLVLNFIDFGCIFKSYNKSNSCAICRKGTFYNFISMMKVQSFLKKFKTSNYAEIFLASFLNSLNCSKSLSHKFLILSRITKRLLL